MLTLREAYGVVLQHQRVESSRSMRDVAKRSGISLSYISDLEKGRKDASSEMLEDLCNALDMELVELLVGAANVLERSTS